MERKLFKPGVSSFQLHSNAIDDVATHPNHYRAPMPSETRTYELTGFKPENDAARFSFDE